MLRVQCGRCLGRTNERKHIDVTRRHNRREHLATRAVQNVHHTGRKAVAKQRQQRHVTQSAGTRRLQHYGIAHDQCWDQCSEGFVDRVVVWCSHQYHAQRRSFDLCHHTTVVHHLRHFVLQRFQFSNSIVDVVHCAINFFVSCSRIFANLPHNDFGNFFTLFFQTSSKVGNSLDAFTWRHSWPNSFIISKFCTLNSFQSSFFIAINVFADFDFVIFSNLTFASNRRENFFKSSIIFFNNSIN
mmetsp:Transcript_3398/g.5497  ORF Transcript_3398/g.5497 Transcript_3398/m.5497 type:complete len:242 (-) Transcript_3398:94-819(-)